MTGQGQAVRPNSHDSRGFPALFQPDLPCLPPVLEGSLLAHSAGVFRKIRVPGMALELWFLENAAVPQECGSSSGALPLQVCGARRATGVWHMERVQKGGSDPPGVLLTGRCCWRHRDPPGRRSRKRVRDPGR